MEHRHSQARSHAIALLCMACMIAVSGCARNTEDAALQGQYRRGENIFLGNEHPPARIAGHQDPLPPQVARCVNCHAPSHPAPATAESAPPLTRTALLQTRARRGGPMFSYERESFCSTVRSGIDPEHVILNRAMPRFDMDDEQCLALWLFLTEKRNDEKQ